MRRFAIREALTSLPSTESRVGAGALAILGTVVAAAFLWGEASWLVVLLALPMAALLSVRYSVSMHASSAGTASTRMRCDDDRVTGIVVVPVILRKPEDVMLACACVERNVAADPDDRFDYAILYDFPDASSEHMSNDALLKEEADRSLTALRASLALTPGIVVDHHFRSRVFDEVDRLWLGWERKRGKLVEFMRFLRGDCTTTFLSTPPSKRYDVILTLDCDSVLRPGSTEALVDVWRCGSPADTRPAIVAPTLDVLRSDRESLYSCLHEPLFREEARLGPLPTDRQLLFGRDLFYGKGLIDIDGFLESAATPVPANAVLSHDHLESLYATTVSTSLAVVAEPFPQCRVDWERRQHRWFRGDFQLLPWVVRGTRSGGDGGRLSIVNRIRVCGIVVADLAPALCFVGALWVFAAGMQRTHVATGLILMLMGTSAASLPMALANLHNCGALRSVRMDQWKEFVSAGFLRILIEVLTMQRASILVFDAFIVSCIRLMRGRRDLLEWHPLKPSCMIRRATVVETLMLLSAAIIVIAEAAAAGLFIVIAFSAAGNGLLHVVGKRRFDPSWNAAKPFEGINAKDVGSTTVQSQLNNSPHQSLDTPVTLKAASICDISL